METGKLQKMKLIGFKDVGFMKPSGFSYTASVNPETYILNHEIQLNKEEGQGKSATTSSFTNVQPQKLDFEFLFDGTGVLGDLNNPLEIANKMPVDVQIEVFKKTVFDLIGETHEPPYVLLQWGTLLFKGRVEKLQLTYKLFNSAGIPLRAIAKVTFAGVIDNLLEAVINKLSSPDLTHLRTVKAGDTLPLMCFDIYGDSTLYGEVARVNNLINFRVLAEGQTIFFPPIQN